MDMLATAVKLLPMPISTLGGWHPDAHRGMGTIAVNIASRTLGPFYCGTLLQLQVTLSVSCLDFISRCKELDPRSSSIAVRMVISLLLTGPFPL